MLTKSNYKNTLLSAIVAYTFFSKDYLRVLGIRNSSDENTVCEYKVMEAYFPNKNSVDTVKI